MRFKENRFRKDRDVRDLKDFGDCGGFWVTGAGAGTFAEDGTFGEETGLYTCGFKMNSGSGAANSEIEEPSVGTEL